MQAMLAWDELPPWMRLLRASAISGWVVVVASLLTVGIIETAALHQPTTADSYFAHPHDIKGRIRFFSNQQERIYVVAKPLMISSFVITFVLFCFCGRLEERREQRQKQRQLQQIAQRMIEQETER
jgi:hypothetical protein